MVCVGHVNLSSCAGHTTTPCIGHNAAVCSGHTTTSCATNSSAVCTSHVNSCPAHSGYIPAVAATTWTNPTLSTSITINHIHFNELRTAMYNEAVRRSKSWVDPGWKDSGYTITSANVRQMRENVKNLSSWTYPTYLNDANTGTDDTVEHLQIKALRDRINAHEVLCVCNCNYACTCQCNYACTCKCNYACTCQCNYWCTCNCNYACTCQCNYTCTCACNYCTCVCNYSCTCNCAYSDERLKTEIVYM